MDSEITILGTGASRTNYDFSTETWGVCGAYSFREEYLEAGKPFHMEKLFVTDHLFSPAGALHFDLRRIQRTIDEYGMQFISLHPMQIGSYKIKVTRYPINRIIKKFNIDYFSSTICYVMAYALDKNVKKINLHGVDMSTKQEYFLQKAGVEYWIGRANQMGVGVFVAEGSSLMKTPNSFRYGTKPKYNMKLVDPRGLLKNKCTTKTT